MAFPPPQSIADSCGSSPFAAMKPGKFRIEANFSVIAVSRQRRERVKISPRQRQKPPVNELFEADVASGGVGPIIRARPIHQHKDQSKWNIHSLRSTVDNRICRWRKSSMVSSETVVQPLTVRSALLSNRFPRATHP